MRILPTKEEVNTICMLVAIGMWVRIGWDFSEGVDPCSIIHDGDRIRVDGESGRVEILEERGAL